MARDGQRGITLAAVDAGLGIPSELLAQGFDAFPTAKPAGAAFALWLPPVRG